MRNPALLVAALTITPGSAQDFLTTGEVFDFEPGDVYAYRILQGSNGFQGPGTYTTDSIISEVWSIDSSEVTYGIHRFYYAPPSWPDDEPVFSNYILYETYGDLDVPAVQYVHPNAWCFTLGDSLGAGTAMCSADAWYTWSTVEDSCFEAPGWMSYVVRGGGGPYYQYQDPMIIYWKELVRLRKGDVNCGGMLPNAVDEVGLDPLQRVWPNPCDEVLNVPVRITGSAFTICSLDGKALLRGSIVSGTIAVDSLRSGVYFLRLGTAARPMRFAKR